MRTVAIVRGAFVLLLAGATFVACGSSEGDEGDTGTGGGAPAAAGAAGSSSGGASGSRGMAPPIGFGGMSSGAGAVSSGGRGGFTGECAGEVTTGKLLPLDMFVMLDTSGSMLETAAGTDKWSSVKQAMTTFLRDPGSAGLGVGVQYFPLRKPDAPESCTSNAQCGSSGPCFLKLCWGGFLADEIRPCEVPSDCVLSPLEELERVEPAPNPYGPCVAFGVCENDPEYICNNVGGQCGAAGGILDLGACVPEPSICLNSTQCDASAYATPAVEIARLPAAANALVASMEAREPSGDTPTGPALQGAHLQARQWALAHPGHTVVTVLATDGLPTQCSPLAIPEISQLAQRAAAAQPSIRTFVIGVFGGVGDAQASANLGAIARAGGTERAYIVDTGQDVGRQFLEALNAIRGSRLTCEFQIPEAPPGETLEYGQVNVLFTDGATTTPLYFVGSSEAACAGSAGWYYDSDPALKAPTRIVACPSSCAAISASEAGSVQIQLGCATIPR